MERKWLWAHTGDPSRGRGRGEHGTPGRARRVTTVVKVKEPLSGRRIRQWASPLLVGVGAIGFLTSWKSVYDSALPRFGERLAWTFPLLLDLGALLGAVMWIAAVRDGLPGIGWRLLAHGAISGSIGLNALAAVEAGGLGEVPWHIAAPAMWAVLIELLAAHVAKSRRRLLVSVEAEPARIRPVLWLATPILSARALLWMAVSGERDAAAARERVGRATSARRLLRERLAKARWTRLDVGARIADGTLAPDVVVDAIEQSAGLSEKEFVRRLYMLIAKPALLSSLFPATSREPNSDGQVSPSVAPEPTKEREVPAAIPSPRPRPVRRPTKQRRADWDELLKVAEQAAQDLRREGRALSQRSLAAAIRGRGYSFANEQIGLLLAQVKDSVGGRAA